MGKISSRKPRPSPPYWHWLGADGCWFCKNRKACNGCKTLKCYRSRRDLRSDASYTEQITQTGEMQ